MVNYYEYLETLKGMPYNVQLVEYQQGGGGKSGSGGQQAYIPPPAEAVAPAPSPVVKDNSQLVADAEDEKRRRARMSGFAENKLTSEGLGASGSQNSPVPDKTVLG